MMTSFERAWNEMTATEEGSNKANHGTNFQLTMLLDINAPWLLVPEGSFNGKFDAVPRHLRVGPWHPAATAMLIFLYSSTYVTSFCWKGWTQTNLGELPYPVAYTVEWWYHTMGFAWMCYIMHLATSTAVGYGVLVTYTVQSWALLTVRHGLCALAPWSTSAAVVAEGLRFLCAVWATQTFVVWNFLLMPFVYFVMFKGSPARQKGFLNFCFSFVLVNMHGLNIVLCWMNVGGWGSPRRVLEFADFYISIVALMAYFTFYVFILDRLGIHLYPMFSPRTALLPLAWAALFCIDGSLFVFWRWMIKPV